MKKIAAFLMIAVFVLSAAALAETPVEGALYAGIDPWGNPLSVTLTRTDALCGVWSQNFYGELFVCDFENAQDGFALEGPLSGSDCDTCRYTGIMALDGDALTVTFTGGEMTTESPEGGSTSYHVAALDDAQRTVTLVPAVPGDYSGVTTLGAPAVEAFAAWVRQLYLDGDWDAMAQLIDYPIILYPDVAIDDGDAFAAFMADKVITESDIEAMTAETCVGMMSNGQGICMGSGQTWLRDIAFDGVEQTGEPQLRVVALSGLAD